MQFMKHLFSANTGQFSIKTRERKLLLKYERKSTRTVNDSCNLHL